MSRVFHARHERLPARVNAIPGISCLPAGGAFYLMLDVRGMLEKLNSHAQKVGDERLDDASLVRWPLEHHDLALAAGTWFGAPGYLHCSVAAAHEVLEEATHRLQLACDSIGCT